jgi:Flp pilus assembly pilin Flp
MRHSGDRPVHRRSFAARLRREDGVEGLEVALIGVLIVIVILAAIPPLSASIGDTLQDVGAAITTAGVGIE